MSTSPNLKLPFLQAAQAQKHVTVNEALKALDVLVQLAVLDRDLATPPVSPVDGDRYIVAAGPTGAWAGKAKSIAAWLDGAWTFFVPPEGWLAWIRDENILTAYDGSAWASYSATITELQNLSKLGIGTTADATNPLSAKINKALFTAKTVAEGGDGDLRYTLNKETASDVLSLLFQSNFSGRAEMGLIGDDNFLIKVSPDGSAFNNAILIDKTTGAVSFPSTTLLTDDSVTDAKLRNSAGLSVIGRSASTNGDPADIAAGSDGQVLRRSGAALGFGAIATAGITDDAITNAKLANVATATLKGRTTAGSGDPEDLSAAQATAILNAMVGDSGSGGTKGLVPAPASGDAAANKVLNADGSWKAGNLRLLDATAFTANGTWTKPAGAKLVWIVVIGGGGGGGSGCAGDNTANRGGAGGGGGGTLALGLFDAGQLSATESVTVGASANGGAGVTGGSVGNAGSAGNPSSFGAHLTAPGGNAGAGGANAATAAGGIAKGPAGATLATWSAFQSGAGASGSGGATGALAVRSAIGPGGGGAGGGLVTVGTSLGGGAGAGQGFVPSGLVTNGGGGAGGAAGGGNNGAAGASNSGTATDDFGYGGGGGSSFATGNSGAGGDGGAPGGGGGGGGGARNTFTSGAGGAGARGEVRVCSYG